MFIRKLKEVDAFVAIDLKDVSGRGVVRCAPKVLQGGAKDLARTTTYALAILERRESGISAGINAPPEERENSAAAFASELASWDINYRFAAAKGVEPGSLGEMEISTNLALIAIGAVAAGLAACPGAETAVLDGTAGSELATELAAQGISVVETDEPMATKADLLFVGGKVGSINHVVADQLNVRTVVPTGPLPITTKAVAHCHRHGVLALPDFVTTIGPLIGEADSTRTVVAELVQAALGHPDGPVLGACEKAESFLGEWQENLPFGRPMAA